MSKRIGAITGVSKSPAITQFQYFTNPSNFITYTPPAVGDLATPNQQGVLSLVGAWNGPTTNTGLVANLYSFLGLQNTITNPGHAVAVMGQIQANATGKVLDLAIGVEGKHTHVAGTLTNAIGVLGVMTSNAAAITNWFGVGSQITANSAAITNAYMHAVQVAANAGTITNLYGYHFPDLSGLTGITNRYALLNADAGAPILSASELQFGTVTPDSGLKRVAASTIQVTNAAGGQGYLNMAGRKYNSTQFDKTGNVTLNDITGLSVSVLAGRAYRFRAELYVTADATGGHKYQISGNATATAIIYEVVSFDNTAKSIKLASRATALNTAVGEASGTVYKTTIDGTILVNAAGTLTVQFAQNASNLTSSVLVGSNWTVEDIT